VKLPGISSCKWKIEYRTRQ